MMKYDVLLAYRKNLEEKYSRETARTYFNRLEHLLEGQSLIDTIENLDLEKILSNLSEIKYKNYFSQSKNSLFHFCTLFHIPLSNEYLNQIKILEEKTIKKYRKHNAIDFKEIDKKIKHLKNKKLKLSYQALLSTGLRVSELSELTPSHTIISNDELHFSFIAKGGALEEVIISKKEHSKLFNNLINHINNTNQSKKIFYSSIYLQMKAKELGFKCHDLRRIFAKLEYRKTKSKNEVMKKLRHTSIKNTNIYLRSKVKI